MPKVPTRVSTAAAADRHPRVARLAFAIMPGSATREGHLDAQIDAGAIVAAVKRLLDARP